MAFYYSRSQIINSFFFRNRPFFRFYSFYSFSALILCIKLYEYSKHLSFQLQFPLLLDREFIIFYFTGLFLLLLLLLLFFLTFISLKASGKVLYCVIFLSTFYAMWLSS